MNLEEKTRSPSGPVIDIFAHRFVVKTEKCKVLADLGLKGVERIALREGDRVELIGEMKPWGGISQQKLSPTRDRRSITTIDG
jgi:hypothetical protein